MKNQSIDHKESITNFSSQHKEQNQIKHNLKCISQNLATQACMQKKCDKNPFLCSNKLCQCRKSHKTCLKLTIQSLIKKLQSKKFHVQDIETCINDKIQQMINQLSDFRDNLITKLREDFQMFGLNKLEKQFIVLVKNYGKNDKMMTGSHIWEIVQSEVQQQFTHWKVMQTKQKLQNIFIKAKYSFKQSQKSITKLISDLNTQVQKVQQTYTLPNEESTQDNQDLQLKSSKIITSFEQFVTLGTFFAPRIIDSIKLLYRASQNNFQVKKFHQTCDGVAGTLVLVETQFGKKIGGYTPVKWSSKDNWVNDKKFMSFLFSLTEGDKFILTKQNYALRHNEKYGPIFGATFASNDLCIYDKADINQSLSNINHIFKHPNYEYNKRKSWQKFHGNSNNYTFKIKQWEVWRIQFV